jgi:hypothetical protein
MVRDKTSNLTNIVLKALSILHTSTDQVVAFVNKAFGQ